MSTPEQGSAQLPFRAAMEARDLPAVIDTFSPHAVLRSPFTEKLAFSGHAQIAALTQVLLDVIEELRYTDELIHADMGFLVGRGRVGGQTIEWVDHLRFDSDAKISELTVFFRPLPASAAALRVIGAALSRRRSPGRAAAVSALALPLALMTRFGDGVGTRLVGPSL